MTRTLSIIGGIFSIIMGTLFTFGSVSLIKAGVGTAGTASITLSRLINLLYLTCRVLLIMAIIAIVGGAVSKKMVWGSCTALIAGLIGLIMATAYIIVTKRVITESVLARVPSARVYRISCRIRDDRIACSSNGAYSSRRSARHTDA